MRLKKEVIEGLAGKDRAQKLLAAQGIADEVARLEKKKVEEIQKLNATLKDLQISLQLVREKCDHPATEKHHGAMSGDYYEECLVCGKRL